jgi:hypothetical protein
MPKSTAITAYTLEQVEENIKKLKKGEQFTYYWGYLAGDCPKSARARAIAKRTYQLCKDEVIDLCQRRRSRQDGPGFEYIAVKR